MTEPYRVVALPGERIGPEIVDASLKVLQHLAQIEGFSLFINYALIGQTAFEKYSLAIQRRIFQ